MAKNLSILGVFSTSILSAPSSILFATRDYVSTEDAKSLNSFYSSDFWFMMGFFFVSDALKRN